MNSQLCDLRQVTEPLCVVQNCLFPISNTVVTFISLPELLNSFNT